MTAPRVFVSYARSDGEDHARQLRERLAAEGVPLWRDREGMEGGRDWWQQITAAIDQVRFVVLVITPAALASALVRREWRYARQRGVAVYPVLARSRDDDDIDFEALPRWMRSVHFYDLRHEWPKFVADLQGDPRPVRVPFMAEDLPDSFVPRPREHALLAAQLLDREREEPIAITAALRGAGGFGKTLLARALCHDEAVQNAFDDGVLWVTLGERPGDLTARVEDLIFMLSGQRPGFASLEPAVAALAELLADREMLIVIDDVWNAAHLQPFLQGGERCARVVTTRLADVLPPAARRVDVDAMTLAEAGALLSQGLPAGHDGEIAALAARVGEWPLLLRLVNGTLRERVLQHGQPLAAALAWVNKSLDKRGLTGFDARDPVARHEAVATTLGVSLAQLDAGELARLHELAVFPEDASIPLVTVGALWRLDEFDTEALAERLARLSLLLAFDLTWRTVRLHDVVRRFLVERVGAGLPALHARLLDSARPEGGAWGGLAADEPYWWSWLFDHLQAAGLAAELHATALDLRWLAAKAVARTAFSVEADLARAEAAFPDDTLLAALRRAFAQCAHLLGDCADAAAARATLASRLQHLPLLAPRVAALRRALPEPHLAALHPLPDLPHPALLRTLGSHRGIVRACAITSNGSLVATASSDRPLVLCDTKTGTQLRTLAPQGRDLAAGPLGHWVRSLAFSADGALLAAAGESRVWVWALPSGELRCELRGHTDLVTGCAISADGRRLVSSSLDESLRVWDTASGTELRKLALPWGYNTQGWLVPMGEQGHWAPVQGCALSRDGRLAASASSDGTLIVWNADDGGVLRVLVGHQQAVNACAFSPDAAFLASAGADGSLRLWHVESGEQREAVAAHGEALLACAWSDDGQTIVTASADGSLRVWGDDGELLATFSGHTDRVNGCAVSAAAGCVVSAASDGTARLWQLLLRRDPYRPLQHQGWVLGCAAVPQMGFLFTAGQDRALMLWDVRRGQQRRHQPAAHEGSVRGVAVSGDAALLASAGADGTVALWHAADGRALQQFSGHRDWVNACAFQPGGELLASAGNDRTVRLWHLRTRSRRLAFTAHEQWINACAFSPCGRFLVTGAADGTLRRWAVPGHDDALWEAWVSERRPLAAGALPMLALQGHAGSVNQVVYAPGGAWFASAGSDRVVKLWHADTGALLRTLAGHLEDVYGLDVSADGQRVVSVSAEGGVAVWQAASGQRLLSLQVDGALSACAWTGSDTLAAVGARGVYLLNQAPAGIG